MYFLLIFFCYVYVRSLVIWYDMIWCHGFWSLMFMSSPALGHSFCTRGTWTLFIHSHVLTQALTELGIDIYVAGRLVNGLVWNTHLSTTLHLHPLRGHLLAYVPYMTYSQIDSTRSSHAQGNCMWISYWSFLRVIPISPYLSCWSFTYMRNLGLQTFKLVQYMVCGELVSLFGVYVFQESTIG